MIGKANEIKTMLVQEEGGTKFDKTLNDGLAQLQNNEVIEISFKATTDADGVAWFNALIIYKEAAPDAQ